MPFACAQGVLPSEEEKIDEAKPLLPYIQVSQGEAKAAILYPEGVS
jgi:hypothetical protein